MKIVLRLLCVLLPFAAHAAEPGEVVEHLHATLLDNMKQGAALSCAARIKRLEPVVDATFDTPFLAHFMLRKHWTQLSDAQRTRFTAALADFTTTSYAANFHEFDGESFVNTGVEEQGGGQRMVHARLVRKGGDPISFDYVLRQAKPGDWRVVNVIAEGVSDLALRSAQYDKLYAERGFDGLVTWIEAQVHNDKDGC
jgi:phospholipid transport system substrate-binding protein